MQRESNWRYFFIIFITLACLVSLYPTAKYAWFVEKNPAPKAEDYPDDPGTFKQKEDEYNQIASKKQRDAITLGLDIVGGVDIQLKIDRPKTLSKKLKIQGDSLRDELVTQQISGSVGLNQAGDRIVVKIDNASDAKAVVDTLEKQFTRTLDLTSYDKNALATKKGAEIEINDKYMQAQLKDALRSSENIIRDRIDSFGVTMPSVSLQEDNMSIRVQVPGARDAKRVISEVIRPAQLEFRPLYGAKDMADGAHDNKVSEIFESVEWEKGDPAAAAYVTFDIVNDKYYGWKLKDGQVLPTGFVAMAGKPLEAQDKTVAPDMTNPVGKVYLVTRTPEMIGDDLRDAYMRTDPSAMSDPIRVSLTFGSIGTGQFYNLSKTYLKKRVAIVVDNKVYSAPVFRQVISGGQGEISGGFSAEEAQNLAMALKAGSLKADLLTDSERTIGPTLGAESLIASLKALAIGACGVTVFMVLYYGMAGVISILALALNILVIFGCLNMFQGTLTLSGIGGMILTLGMAVDANVLIYERIREEVASGKQLVSAIRSGFGQAFSVILDSNLTTLLAAFVLLQFGEGSVQGFALTMAFGLLANLFTGLMVTYALCSLWFRLRGGLSIGKISFFQNTNFDFIHMRKITFPLSGIIVAGSLIFLLFNGGPNMAVDFRGGIVSEVRIDTENDPDQSETLKKMLDTEGLGAQAKVQRVRDEHLYIIRLALLPLPETILADLNPDSDSYEEDMARRQVDYTGKKLEDMLNKSYSDGTGIEVMSTNSVSPEVGQTFRNIALMVIIAASLCILAYLWFRFELVFGVAAVIALLHDLIITIGVISLPFALFNIQISLDIVSALLILLGFSVNDTIVIFDRIRENTHLMYNSSFKNICNNAMNRTLTRTIITSSTTIGVMFVMYLFGGHSLAPFAMTLIVGGLVGTYSSDFVAAPLVYWWNERQSGQLAKDLSRKGIAQASEADFGSTAPKAATAGAAQPQRRGRR